MLLLQKQLKREEDKKRSLSHRKGLSSRRWNFKSTTGIYYHQFINTVLDLKYSFLKEAPEAYHSLEMQASLKIKVVHTLTQSQSCRNLTHLQANTHSPQATSIRHEEARQHILSLVMMQLHPAHSNSDLYRALKNINSKNFESELKLHAQKFRSKPNSVFIQVTTCPLYSRQQISGFDNLPAPSYISSTVFHSFGSLSTHSFLCITLQTLIRHLV